VNTTDQDILLWETFRSGDKEAFAILFRKYYSALFFFGNKFSSDKQLLEDAIQELFIELWQAKSQAPVFSVKAYLLKSLKYKLLKLIKRSEQAETLDENSDLHFEWSHENFLIAEQESEEKKQQLLLALAQLSNRQKEIIYLKYYQNLNYEEVSEIMNINYQAARNLLYQSIKALKKILLNTMCLLMIV
jgi:RNA polymerase sigma-70 factor (ECF subfamily)